MKSRIKFSLILFLGFIILGVKLEYASSETLNIPLIIQEALPEGVSGMNRLQEPVTVGIPLEESSGIKDINQFGLSGATLGQFRILAKWPNGNIKWVLVDTQATVQANRQNISIYLTSGTGNFGGDNLALDNGTTIAIDTGPAQFTIRKANFNLIDKVIVNSQTLVSSGHQGGVRMYDANNTLFSSNNDSSSTAAVEENGPARAVIKSEGALKDSSGLRLMDYTLRIHFYKNKSYVKTYVTLRNARHDSTTAKTFNSAELYIPLNLSEAKSFEFARKADSVSATFSGNETAYLYQAFSIDKFGGDGWRWLNAPMVRSDMYVYEQEGYEIKHGSALLHALSTDDDYTRGWGELKDSSGKGLTIALRWMSSMWPASIEFDGAGGASIELYSKYNSKKGLKFAWGSYDTRELMFDFHNSSVNNDQLLYALQYPLFGRAQLDQYANAGAFYGETRLPSIQEEEAWFQKEADRLTSLGANSSWINKIKNTRVPLKNITPSFIRYYSWTAGGGGNQMDFALADLYDFVRTGYGGYYLQGEQQSLYKTDYAILHSDGFNYTSNELKPDNSGSFNGSTMDTAHSHWFSLPILYYLSGNELIKDTITDFGEWWDGLGDGTAPVWYSKPLQGLRDMRIWSRYLSNFTLLYEFTGNSRYKDTYMIPMMKLLLDSRENSPNLSPLGRNLERGYMYMDYTSDTLERYVSDFLLEQIHFEALNEFLRIMKPLNYPRAEEIEEYMSGITDFIYNELYFECALDLYKFGTLHKYYLDTVNNPPGCAEVRHSNSSLPMTYGYQKTGDIKYLDRERNLLLGDIVYSNNPRIPSDRRSQAFIWTDIHRNSPGWHYIPNLQTKNNGSGSYTLTWTVPAGASKYQIKYSNKPIVEWLGFNQLTRAYQYDPSQYTAFFAADNVSDEPPPLSAGTQQTYTITDLNPLNNYYFAIKYTTEGLNALKGDVNNDNQVDVLDVQALVNHILGIQNFGSSADVNTDGSVDVLDVQEVVNVILGTGS